MNPFWEIADFLRGLRREMRFGELSRAPLRLLRLELSDNCLACDWIARPADIWDEGLAQHVRERSFSEQALRDAIGMRDLVFDTLPTLGCAVLHAFRPSGAREPPELIISAVALRDPPLIFRVNSLVMRAKLYGFHFELEDGVLQAFKEKEKEREIFETGREIHFKEEAF